MAGPPADPTTSPKDPITGSGSTGEPPSEKGNRGGRGVAIPHYIAAYKLTSEFMPRDDVGYYLTVSFFLSSVAFNLAVKQLYVEPARHSSGSHAPHESISKDQSNFNQDDLLPEIFKYPGLKMGMTLKEV